MTGGIAVSESQARRALAGTRPEATTREEALEAYAAAVWSVVTEPGDSVAGALVQALGHTAALREAFPEAAAGAGARDGKGRRALAEGRARWLPRLSQERVDAALRRAARAGARLVLPSDPEWPRALADLGVHGPLALWVRGVPLATPDAPAAALVGARAATAYGEHVAGELAAELAGAGVMVVSGAAYGIDGAAHRASLAAGGRTVALLAGGVEKPYPSGHSELIDRICSAGSVLSETPCGTAPTKWRFLARNRLIAALAQATVVVEAGARSGSLNTAAHAASLGRALGAVPGPVTSSASAGCHRILREYGGTCITSVQDILELLGRPADDAHQDLGRPTDDRTRVLDALSVRTSRDVDDVARRSGLSRSDVQSLLGLAVLSGEAEAKDGGWRRVAAP